MFLQIKSDFNLKEHHDILGSIIVFLTSGDNMNTF